ncbi:FmdB family zinc ribbon protein [Desulfosoma caldarium]|uniref:Putative FmdB family regulatory protein n=1 Tax=Desulfosoma caldarium TaxID=610254 RepID=A0A3N1VFC9_9BACT|nr:zinc ribbon domain-containing protein [Desulfosoma caldarium]ROR01595.1 putative FmdB family regulatory protein [Desulfosoma caldarium]
MPIYEYLCLRCGKKNEIITFRISEEVYPQCRHCNSEVLRRLPSRVRVRLSEETRLERLADPSKFGALDENDPKSMAKFMKAMSQEMGDDFDEDVDALVEEAMEEEAASNRESDETSVDDAGEESL